jgi:DGQHR domain-containing protein
VEEIKNWFDADRVYPDIWKREKLEGYQRIPDKERFMKIAEYVEGKLQIEETLLPNSVILNVRKKGVIEFEPFEKTKTKKTVEIGKILIDDAALPFFEVDGQHRVRGLIEAYK